MTAIGRPCRFRSSDKRRLSLRVFGCLPGAGARGCTEAGVRKASKEESAGAFAPAVVSVYGDLTRGCEALPGFRTGTPGGRRAREWREGDLGRSGCRGKGGVALWDLVFRARRRRWRLPSVEGGRYRRDLGAGQAERQRAATRAYWS